MEESNITINYAGQRIATCPICGEEILLTDELVGDNVWCDLCDTPIKLIE